jgi:Rrf2 family protein
MRMLVTQKNQYALRAIFELAKHQGKGLIKISDIAKAQHIPLRFLEVILNQLKRSGLVESKRGYTGGYALLRAPEEITVGEVIRFHQKDELSDNCVACVSKSNCPSRDAVEDCAFMPMWKKVQDSIFDIYDSTTIADLMVNEQGTPE